MMTRRLRICAVALAIACTEQTAPPPVPARPTDLQATLASPNSAHLTWSPGSTADAGLTYDVYRNDVKVGTAATAEFSDTGLAGNATYTWFITARSSAGVSAPSDPAVLFLGDNEAPRITSNTPANAASGVSRLVAASVTFSEPMIPATVNANTVVATLSTGGAVVYGTVNYDPSSRTADFWPLSFLPAGTSITVTIGNGARDVAGNRLASSFSFSFTTGSSPASVDELPPSNEQILMSQELAPGGGFRDIFKMRPDGSGKVNLTSQSASDNDGAWSPDGRHIAFASDRNGNYDIFIIRDDGKGIRQLTNDLVDETSPTWSPDARRILFLSRKDGIKPQSNFVVATDIFSMNADGTQQVNLTHSPAVYDEWASWSPDGRRLLFTRWDLCCAQRIMVANADGTDAVPLRAEEARYRDDYASWSPDGTQIAFSAYDRNSPVFSERYRLFLVDADGSNLRPVGADGGPRFPAWSPDGKMLVYSYSFFDEFWGRFGFIEVRKMDLTTGSQTILAEKSPTSRIMSPQAWRR
jgi:Tol biopolymer transport system component